MSRCRFRLLLFLVKMCRACEWPRLILPVAVIRNRFAAPLCVFSFGMFTPYLKSKISNLRSQKRKNPYSFRKHRAKARNRKAYIASLLMPFTGALTLTFGCRLAAPFMPLGSENGEHLIALHSRPHLDLADVREIFFQLLQDAGA